MTKAQITSVAGLAFLALWTFLTVMNFKIHDWSWGAVSVALMAFESYTINRYWAWKPKTPGDNDKTKDLKKGWSDKL